MWKILSAKSSIKAKLEFGNQALLLTLDLSAAFDTIDRATLLQRLECRYGTSIHGTALKWVQSYMSDRTQESGSSS